MQSRLSWCSLLIADGALVVGKVEQRGAEWIALKFPASLTGAPETLGAFGEESAARASLAAAAGLLIE
jgi:hypothetical protein